MVRLLASARSRRDPPLPSYSTDELDRFVGLYEGWDTDRLIQVTRDGRALRLAIDDVDQGLLEVVGEQAFADATGETRLSFWGRWGTIEARCCASATGDPRAFA